MLSKTRLAFRLAWRDITRNKGRAILATTLLALPIIGVAVGVTAYASMETTDQQRADQFTGEADAYLQWRAEAPIEQYSYHESWVGWQEVDADDDGGAPDNVMDPDLDELMSALPPGSEITPYEAHQASTSAGFITDHGYVSSQVIPGDLSNPLVASVYDFQDGIAPSSGEVALNPALAEELEASVGDTVTTDAQGEEVALTVSGIVEHPRQILQGFLFAPDLDSADTNSWLVSTPDTFTMEDADTLNELGITVYATSLADTPPDQGAPAEGQSAEDLSIVALLVGIVLIQVVLLAGPAFAINAKRRMREFAILSSTGASPSHIRRVVLAGGIILGLIAAIVGIGGGIATAWLALPLIENLIGHRAASFSIWPEFQLVVTAFAVLTGLLAALAAAFAASRVDVVTAMTGRRTQARIHKRWPLLGALLIVTGILLVVTGTIMQGPPVLLATIAMFQLGLALCAPLIVAGISRLGSALPLSPRIALRDAGRNRSATAPAIAAVMAVVAAGLAFSMYALAFDNRFSHWMDANSPDSFDAEFSYSVSTSHDDPDSEMDTLREAQEEILPLLETHLDNPEVLANPSAQCRLEDDERNCVYELQRPEDKECPYDEDPHTLTDDQQKAANADPNCVADEGSFRHGNDFEIVTSPQMLAAYTGLDGTDLSEAWDQLQSGALGVGHDVWIDEEGKSSIQISRFDYEGQEATPVDDKKYSFPSIALSFKFLSIDTFVATPEVAEQLHSQPYADGQSNSYMVRADSNPELEAIQSLNSYANQTQQSDDGAWVTLTLAEEGLQAELAVVWTIAGISLVIALGATLVATGLVAAESRRDLRTLGAIGASPGLRRKLSLWQAGVISLLGSSMGVIAGLGIFMVIIGSFNSRINESYPVEYPYPIEIPWLNLAAALIALPLVAMAITGLAARSRLPSEDRRAD